MQQPTPSMLSSDASGASPSPSALPRSGRAPGSRRRPRLARASTRASSSAAGLTALAGLVALLVAWAPLGCGSSSGTGGSTTSTTSTTGMGGSSSTGAFCMGGFIRMVDGKPTCEGLCKASLCTNANNVCVDNDCALQCTSHLDCAIGQNCAAAKEDGTGAMIETCQSNGKGSIGSKCPFGTECKTLMTCGDGSPCPTTGSCKVGTCKALVCLSSGSGDADAYCTLDDCHGDSDCPGGYVCDTIRDPHQICGGATPDPNVGGTTTDPCVDPSKNAANGTTYAAGQFCTQRNQCRIRAQCDPCTTDLDCSLVAGRHCAQGNCAEDCASDADCVNGFVCTSGECLPRSGSCSAAAGTGKFCDNCRTQADCGKGLLCAELDPGGARTCLNETGSACTSDATCPTSPSGLHAICADARLELSPGQPGYDTCYIAPFVVATGKFGCWAGNKGAGCYEGTTDCISKKCVGADPVNMVPGVCQ